MYYQFNRTKEKSKRRNLRKDMPYPEQVLWRYLRNRNMKGYKFRRQHSVGKYIVDFYCPELQFAIELDGDSHYTEQAMKYDRKRDSWIKQFGVKILRITNYEVTHNLENILEIIADYLP